MSVFLAIGKAWCWLRGPKWEPAQQPVQTVITRDNLPEVVSAMVSGPWRCARCGREWNAHP